MLKLKKIAITGGIAGGKSSVCQFFKELGAYAVSADAIAHELLNTDTALGQQIIQYFGPDIIKNGQIDRKVLAEKVFNQPERLNVLEGLLHPHILRKVEEHYARACKEGTASLFVVEMPLLFEIGADDFYDAIITVVADEPLARKRFEKAGYAKAEYDLRMNRQLTPQQKAAKSHYVLQNNGTFDELRKKVIQLNNIIQQQ